MIILDTDHFSVLTDEQYTANPSLMARLEASPDREIVVSVVTVEEQMRGWLAAIRRYPQVDKQLNAYRRLLELIDSLKKWRILPLERQAANEFNRLRKSKVSIGSQDLKIAGIALVNDALLLSANLRDFRRVPGLRVENWIG